MLSTINPSVIAEGLHSAVSNQTESLISTNSFDNSSNCISLAHISLSLRESGPEPWVCIGIHGGGERNFHPLHPLFGLAYSLGASEFYSVSLPLHNIRNPKSTIDRPEFDSNEIPTLSQFLDATFDALSEVLSPSKKFLFVGHSGGGLTMIRLWPRLQGLIHPDSMGFAIGSCHIEPVHSDRIQAFWTKENYVSQGVWPNLSTIHLNENRTLRMIKFWERVCGVKGEMYLNDQETQDIIINPESRIFMITGAKDQPFPPKHIFKHLPPLAATQKVVITDSDHYKYFNNYWYSTRKAILSFLVTHVQMDSSSDILFAKNRKSRKTTSNLNNSHNPKNSVRNVANSITSSNTHNRNNSNTGTLTAKL